MLYFTKTTIVLWTMVLCFQLSSQAPLSQDSIYSDHPHQEITYPSIVDSLGSHVSYDLDSLSSHSRQRRTVGSQEDVLDKLRSYIRIDAFGQSLYLNVSLNSDFLHGNGPTVEYMQSNGSSTLQGSKHRECFHVGHVDLVTDSSTGEEVMQRSNDSAQWVSISNCAGLHGLIATTNGYLFIEPVMSNDVINTKSKGRQQHVVYKNTKSTNHDNGGCLSPDTGFQKSLEKTVSSTMDQVSSDRLKRSSKPVLEYFIETAIIADKSMLIHHGREKLEAYLLTLMSIVHHLYRDSSIGQPISVALVRVIIFEDEPEGFTPTNVGHTILNDFCSWQEQHRARSQGPHYDIAVMVTRNSICEEYGVNCGTLGMADFNSACDQSKSCNLNKDTGLSTSFTISHELGHNLGLLHDGDPQAQCPIDSSNIMAPSFADSINPHYWSSCSRKQLEEKLSDLDKSSCLQNVPAVTQAEFSGSPVLPGMEYTPTEQCKLQLGPNATHCPEMPNECEFLWCRTPGSSKCVHQHSPPSPGTECRLFSGDLGVCYQGLCNQYDKIIEPRDGGWGKWGDWSECSFTCSVGVQYSIRECDSPVPANGGQYCLGSRKRYQTCNTQGCPNEFRSLTCQQDPPTKGYSSWKSASLDRILQLKLDMCHSHCVHGDSAMIHTKTYELRDGTQCLTANSLGVCLAGECMPVDCSHTLGANSSKDECGVWCGSGDSCWKVSGVYNNVSQHGKYLYYNAITIPEGSVNILINEVTPSPQNYIAIWGSKSQNASNGGFSVMAAGVTNFLYAGNFWVYERALDSSEYYKTEGPLKEDVTVYLLANSMYDGIRYTFSLPKTEINTVTLTEPLYVWKSEKWGKCEAECAWGEQKRSIHCLRLGANDTEEDEDHFLCDPLTKPESTQSCYTEACIYKWAVTSWGSCDAVCGEGQEYRDVTCEWTKKSGDTEVVNGSNCDATTKPTSVHNCLIKCIYKWSVSDWDVCDVICGKGELKRNVSCEWGKKDGETEVVDDGFCSNESVKPDTIQTCQLEDCIYSWAVSTWSSCSAECGEGEQRRNVHCEWVKGNTEREVVSDNYCVGDSKPDSLQSCHLEDCIFSWTVTDWGTCNVTLCGDGQQKRNVYCEWLKKDEDTEVVSDHYCSKELKPSSVQGCRVECVYRWTVANWNSCDAICGRGRQHREVSCEWVKGNHNTEIVRDSLCNSDSKPTTVQQCQKEECTYVWSSKEWSECDVDCGEGWKRREVVCLWVNLFNLSSHTEREAIVSDNLCLSSFTKPDEITVCQAPKACIVYHWDISEWSKCSGPCGTEGHQTRAIHCQDPDGNTVNHSFCRDSAPVNSQICLEECPQTTEPPCADTSSREFCQKIVKFNFCSLYIQLCCASCSQ